jgi:hypothetical protein
MPEMFEVQQGSFYFERRWFARARESSPVVEKKFCPVSPMKRVGTAGVH